MLLDAYKSRPYNCLVAPISQTVGLSAAHADTGNQHDRHPEKILINRGEVETMSFELGQETHTFTILGRCPRTRQLGVCISTGSLAVGGYCPSSRPT